MAARDNISLLRIMATHVQDAKPGLPDAAALGAWLVRHGLEGSTAEAVFDGFCTQLSAGGMAIQRGLCAMRVLHPLYKGFGLIWRRGVDGVKEETYTAVNATPGTWERSTLKVLVDDGVPELRRRILGPEAGEEFPILEDFRQEGATDYFAMVCGFAVEAANGAGTFDGFSSKSVVANDFVNAAAISRPLANRSFGFFSNAFRTTFWTSLGISRCSGKGGTGDS